ncbi:hypothetical protein AYO47_00205 [Planctomyces sp. SCGC AG-212-M04]|nr:hypothetical protein AYO47_00205 [Planctomyces sp. SCGC AG-212-M04]
MEIIGGSTPLPEKTFVSVSTSANDQLHIASTSLAAGSEGQLTLPGTDGDFRIGAFRRSPTRAVAKPATLSVDKDFQFSSVTGVSKPVDDVSVISDSAGHNARLSGAVAVLEAGRLKLQLKATTSMNNAEGQAIGKVVDGEGKPVANCYVTVILGEEDGGSSATELKATTDTEGRFSINGLGLRDSPGVSQKTQVSLAVTADGWGGLDTQPKRLPESAEKPTDFGTIRLSPGRTISLRVVDADEKPIVGAWVEPAGSYSDRMQLASTDEQGKCVVRNLSPGWHNFTARFGGQFGSTKAEARETPSEVTLFVRPVVQRRPSKPPKEMTPIVTGQQAPELVVKGWADNGVHSLGDLKGRIIVLNFWATWCGGCVHEIPTLIKLQKQFGPRDVVFVAVHTADGDMREIREMSSRMGWNALLALDKSVDDGLGESLQRFGVPGLPTVFVIGRDGRVAFTTNGMKEDVFMKLLEQSAKEAGVAWPINESVDSTVLEDQFRRIEERYLTKAIEDAVGAK